jgi:putative spermidine/putrescine transport system permease protein
MNAASVSTVLHRRPGLRLGLLLTPPLLWLGVAYLGALAALFLTAFWGQNAFTGEVERTWTLDNFTTLLTQDVYRTISLRTLGVAVLVTVVDALLAIPIALFMAYAWRGLLSENGLMSWLAAPLGLGSPGYGLPATIITLAYLWLPYMILPIYAGLERLPDSLLEASSDLGAHAWRTTRSIVLPMMFPALVAGSIFTFSLSLGDYITVEIVGGASQMLGNVVYDNVGAANNLPFAAAMATVPVVIMFAYLAAVRRTGALENL